MNKTSRKILEDQYGVHARNLHLLDSMYGLSNIDYVCLKILGCHHPQFHDENLNELGLTEGGQFPPLVDGNVEQQDFELEQVDEATLKDAVIYVKTYKKAGRDKCLIL